MVDDDQRWPRCSASSCAARVPAVVRRRRGTALSAFRDARPDIVLLDLMLPGMSGIDVGHPGRGRCADRRADAGDTVDVVLGLESGADDYVVKPFKPKELVARMRARLRRGEDVAPELSIGPTGNQITIDVPAHTVLRNGEEVKPPRWSSTCWSRWPASPARSSP